MSTPIDVSYHYTEDWTWGFTAENFEGIPIDITDATLRFRLATIDGTAVMTLTEDDGFEITSGIDGQCTLQVTPAHQTNAGVSPSTRYLWEFRITTSGDVVLTQAHGHLTVLPSLFSS